MSVPALDPPSGGARRPRRPTVRRVPRLEPPYDDELPDGPLSLIRQREELPFEEPAPRRFEHEIDFFDPQPTTRGHLPEPEAWATRFLQAVFETLAGSRASAQLHDWTSQAVRSQISRMTFDVRWKTPPGVVPLVKSVRVSEPADGVAEVAAVVLRGAVYSAAAARLEGFDGRWRAVALEVR